MKSLEGEDKSKAQIENQISNLEKDIQIGQHEIEENIGKKYF